MDPLATEPSPSSQRLSGQGEKARSPATATRRGRDQARERRAMVDASSRVGQRGCNALAPAPERAPPQAKRIRGDSAKRVAIDVLRAALYGRTCANYFGLA